jgi:hypothetical protein
MTEYSAVTFEPHLYPEFPPCVYEEVCMFVFKGNGGVPKRGIWGVQPPPLEQNSWVRH